MISSLKNCISSNYGDGSYSERQFKLKLERSLINDIVSDVPKLVLLGYGGWIMQW